jgi:hypothetical protein
MNLFLNLLISLVFISVAVEAFHGQHLRQLQQRIRVPTPGPDSALIVNGGVYLNKLVRLLSSPIDDAMIGNTVVSRCTKKIMGNGNHLYTYYYV